MPDVVYRARLVGAAVERSSAAAVTGRVRAQVPATATATAVATTATGAAVRATPTTKAAVVIGGRCPVSVAYPTTATTDVGGATFDVRGGHAVARIARSAGAVGVGPTAVGGDTTVVD